MIANESRLPTVIETLTDLVRINSVNPNYSDGVPEAAIADYVQAYFDRLGVETWLQDLYPGRSNVLARIPGREADRRVILEAHMDTVSCVGMTIDPWAAGQADGKLYGRGACDTKGGMAAMMHAMAQVALMSEPPRCEVVFAATIDEEYSFRGVVAVCDSLAAGTVAAEVLAEGYAWPDPIRADAAIVAEPTELKMVVASKGLVRWRIETIGKAAHSAKPHLGVNAIEHMAKIILAIENDNRRLAHQPHPLLGPATCNIGVVRGGVQVNFVPDRCEIELDRRMLPGESTQSVLDHYQSLVDQVVKENPDMQVVMHRPMLQDRPLETAAGNHAVRVMQQVLESMKLETAPAGVPFCSDASKFGAIGIPTMIFGPGSIDQAHAAVEYVPCDEVMLAAEIYRRFILEF